jgi:hypothetical protein
MAVLLAAAMLLSQVLPIDGGDVLQEPLPGPSDDAAVAEAVETAPAVEAMPAPSQGPVRAVWVRLAQCESSGRWHVNTGNGYFGGLQEDMTFWHNYGYDVDHPGALMAARPDLATPGQQVIAAERGLKAQGFGAWPACSRRLGLR